MDSRGVDDVPFSSGPVMVASVSDGSALLLGGLEVQLVVSFASLPR